MSADTMAGSNWPFVTVVMPVRNEGAYIDISVGAVLEQDYPADRMEVLVADGRSTDGTRERLQAMAGSDRRVRILDNPGRIVATGLNLAVREARGDIVVRVDGHCRVAPDYVRRGVEHLQQDGIDAVGGPLDTVGETWRARVIAAAMSSAFGVGGSAFRTQSDRTMITDTVAFPAYTKRVLDETGPFDEELVRNQDDEYNYRLRKRGGKVLLAADVHAKYFSRAGYKALARQYYQYGFWKVRVMQKHPRQMRWRQFVPAVFVMACVTVAAMAPMISLGWWPFGTLIAAYGSAVLAASIAVAVRRGWDLGPGLPAAFAILHIAYGAGFLVGLVRFAGRWFERPHQRIPAGAFGSRS